MTGAIARDAATGSVLIDPNKCVHCTACEMTCPFEVIRFDEDAMGPEGKVVAIKCDNCIDRLRAGGQPACADVCQNGAILYDKPTASSAAAMRPAAEKPGKISLGISLFQILAMFRRGIYYTYLSVYLRHFLGLSVTETTLFVTVPLIVNIIFQTLVWGAFSDKRQLRRTLIIWGEFLAGIGTVGVWYAHTLTDSYTAAGYVIIIGLSVIEAFWSMSNIGWTALIADIYRYKDRMKVQGRLAGIGGIGRFGGVWIGGLLYDGLGAQYAGWGFHNGPLFFIAAGAMLISIIPILFVPEGGIRRERHQPVASIVAPDNNSTSMFLIFLIGMIFVNFGKNSVAVMQTQYLMLESGFDVTSQLLSRLINTQSVALILTGLAAGWIARLIGTGYALLTGAAMAVGALVLLATAGSLDLIYLSNVLSGSAEALILASSYAFVSILIPPMRRARLFGLFNATFFVSWALAGTLVTGPITDILITSGAVEEFAYRIAFASAGAMTLIGLFIHGLLVFNLKPKNV